MNTNTVNLNIERYNELRDLETNIHEGGHLVLEFGSYPKTKEVFFFTNKQIDRKIKEEIAAQKKEIQTLTDKNNKLSNELLDLKRDEKERRGLRGTKEEMYSEMIYGLKNMNMFEFSKWKKSQQPIEENETTR